MRTMDKFFVNVNTINFRLDIKKSSGAKIKQAPAQVEIDLPKKWWVEIILVSIAWFVRLLLVKAYRKQLTWQLMYFYEWWRVYQLVGWIKAPMCVAVATQFMEIDFSAHINGYADNGIKKKRESAKRDKILYQVFIPTIDRFRFRALEHESMFVGSGPIAIYLLRMIWCLHSVRRKITCVCHNVNMGPQITSWIRTGVELWFLNKSIQWNRKSGELISIFLHVYIAWYSARVSAIWWFCLCGCWAFSFHSNAIGCCGHAKNATKIIFLFTSRESECHWIATEIEIFCTQSAHTRAMYFWLWLMNSNGPKAHQEFNLTFLISLHTQTHAHYSPPFASICSSTRAWFSESASFVVTFTPLLRRNALANVFTYQW